MCFSPRHFTFLDKRVSFTNSSGFISPKSVSSQRIVGRGRNRDARCRVTSSTSWVLLTTWAGKPVFQPVFLLHRTGPARSEKWGSSSSPPGPTTASQNTRHLSSLSSGESRPVTLPTQARWSCTAGKDHGEHLFSLQSGVWGDRKRQWFLIGYSLSNF